VAGTLELPDGQQRSLALKAIPGRPGWFAGHLVVDWTGPAAIRVPLPADVADQGGGSSEETLIKHLRVERSDVELRSLALRAEALMQLTEETGGEYLPLAEANRLPDLISSASQVKTARGTDQPLWDKAWVLAAIAALLAVEWVLRRRNHLL
jgi:hypothetical protein